jgi:hypothetical protein
VLQRKIFDTLLGSDLPPGPDAWWVYVLASTRAPRDIERGGLTALLELSDDSRWDDPTRARIQRLSRRGVKTTSVVEAALLLGRR